MTRTFDSGLLGAIPTLIRNDTIALLAPLLRSAGGFAMGIVPFPFTVKPYVQDDYELAVLVEQLGGRSPAFAVCVGDAKGERRGAPGNNWGTFEVEVYSYSTHARNMVLGRLAVDQQSLADDHLDPGIEVMRELVRMLLTDSKLVSLSTKATDLKWTADVHLITTREITVWASRFEVGVQVDINLKRNITEFLAEIRTSHRVGAGDPPNPATPPLITTSTDVT